MIAVEIDDELMGQVGAVTGRESDPAAVVAGLRRLVQLDRQRQALMGLQGTGWDALAWDDAVPDTLGA